MQLRNLMSQSSSDSKPESKPNLESESRTDSRPKPIPELPTQPLSPEMQRKTQDKTQNKTQDKTQDKAQSKLGEAHPMIQNVKDPQCMIHVKLACEHNLRSVNLQIPRRAFVVFTGVSGSGKSSMAFDTIYREGQRRYLSVLGTHGRDDHFTRPKVQSVEGLSATVAIEQKSISRQPRSTVGTLTQIHDYLRVLYAHAATPHCPISGESLNPQSIEQISHHIHELVSEATSLPCYILAPLEESKKGTLQDLRERWLRAGYQRAYIDGVHYDLEDRSWDLDPAKSHSFDLVIDRFKGGASSASTFARVREAVESALDLGNGLCKLITGEKLHLFSTHAYSAKSRTSYPPLTPTDFSFNSPSGMCSECHGLGRSMVWNLKSIINEELSISEGAIALYPPPLGFQLKMLLCAVGEKEGFTLHTPLKEMTPQMRSALLEGYDPPWVTLELHPALKRRRGKERVLWKGLLGIAWERYQEYRSSTAKKRVELYMTEGLCYECKGSRIKNYPAAAKLHGKTIQQLCGMSASEVHAWLKAQHWGSELMSRVGPVIAHITSHLEWMIDLGLGYLSLDRAAPTLSGGEAQRIRLSAHLGSGLTGVTYILDEPSIGLHARDNRKLIAALKALQGRGNSVIVVEHDDETILESDWVVDFGPGAGSLGGDIVYSGDVDGLLKCQTSATGKSLTTSPRLHREVNKPFTPKEHLKLKGCSRHNLKNFDLSIPLKGLIGLTGVSGSGKSSLLYDCIYGVIGEGIAAGKRQLPVGGWVNSLKSDLSIDKVIHIDQSPIGRLPRSNPATYTKLFDDIRALFTMLPDSKARGYKPGRFSFNVKEGSCPACRGMGYTKVNMDFLPDEYVVCKACQGRQFDESTLDITYRDHTIYDILQLSVTDALSLFKDHPAISKKLKMLEAVGLGYMPIGHPSPYLSGGEAQRVKLAKELIRPPKHHTLYLLDEPTTGLSLCDIQRLLNVLNELTQAGHTVIVIEHHLDLLMQCDWLIELGPEGGSEGGRVVATTTPQKLRRLNTPTGLALDEHQTRLESGRLIDRSDSAKARATLAKEKLTTRSSSSDAAPTTEGAIEITRARQNNLKDINLTLSHRMMHTVTGIAGAGKSSLLQQTLYSYSLRQYSETLTAYARQFLNLPPEPKVDRIDGLGPCVMVHGEHRSNNPRSTVGTASEIYDYLRILYIQMGTSLCPKTLRPIVEVNTPWLAEQLSKRMDNERVMLLAPMGKIPQEHAMEALERALRQGFVRASVDGQVIEIADILDSEGGGSIAAAMKQLVELSIVVDRVSVGRTPSERIASAIDTACDISKGSVLFQSASEQILFNKGLCEPISGNSYQPLTPQDVAFNHPKGWCNRCRGLGTLDSGLDTSCLMQSMSTTGELIEKSQIAKTDSLIKRLSEEGVDLSLPFCELSPRIRELILWGAPATLTLDPSGKIVSKAKLTALAPKLPLPYGSDLRPCPDCGGGRVATSGASILLCGYSLPQLALKPLREVAIWCDEVAQELEASSRREALSEPLRQVRERLRYLGRVGLDYLTLHASLPTLSLGERSRVRLAKQLGAGLSELCYILDEVSCGLHPRDSEMLAHTLDDFKKQGNTVIIADHNPHWIERSDTLTELGPAGGSRGGQVTFHGSLEAYKTSERPLAKMLWAPLKPRAPREMDLAIGTEDDKHETREASCSATPQERQQVKHAPSKHRGFKSIEVKRASAHVLKSIDVSIPLNALTMICGPSGSGKSSLLESCLWEPAQATSKNSALQSFRYCDVEGLTSFKHVEYVDGSQVGRSARADVGSYLELLAECRQIWAKLPQARAQGLDSRYFSPNVPKGMCKKCLGLGYRTIDLKFMPPTRVECGECQGMRLQPRSLAIDYQGKNFGELLDMTLETAGQFLSAYPKITRTIEAACDLGLGHLKLGEEIARLSIGEAQRLKLTTSLKKKQRSTTLFLLDEPSKGLHPKDMEQLINSLYELIERGHTVICVEHAPQMLALSDYIIELGPEGGPAGGELIFQGRPADLMKEPSSKTAPYIKPYLSPI